MNRETQFFFIPYFVAVLYRRLPRQRLALATLLQVAIFLTIRGLILVLFKNNTNPDAFDAATPYEIHLKFNIVFLVTHYFGSVAYTVTCGGVALAVFFAFKQLSWFIQRSLVAYALPLLLLILVIGYLHETRVFLEIMPLLWLATIQAMHRLCTAREKGKG